MPSWITQSGGGAGPADSERLVWSNCWSWTRPRKADQDPGTWIRPPAKSTASTPQNAPRPSSAGTWSSTHRNRRSCSFLLRSAQPPKSTANPPCRRTAVPLLADSRPKSSRGRGTRTPDISRTRPTHSSPGPQGSSELPRNYALPPQHRTPQPGPGLPPETVEVAVVHAQRDLWCWLSVMPVAL